MVRFSSACFHHTGPLDHPESRAVLALAYGMIALRQFQLPIPGGPGFPHLRTAGLAVTQLVQELRHLASILAIDQVNPHRADRILNQLTMEEVDQSVDRQHSLSR